MVRYRDAISIIVVTIMIFSAFPISVSDSSDAVGMTEYCYSNWTPRMPRTA